MEALTPPPPPPPPSPLSTESLRADKFRCISEFPSSEPSLAGPNRAKALIALGLPNQRVRAWEKFWLGTDEEKRTVYIGKYFLSCKWAWNRYELLFDGLGQTTHNSMA